MTAGEMLVRLTGAQRAAPPHKHEELFEFLGHDRELELSLG
jgi:hypothetical protein